MSFEWDLLTGVWGHPMYRGLITDSSSSREFFRVFSESAIFSLRLSLPTAGNRWTRERVKRHIFLFLVQWSKIQTDSLLVLHNCSPCLRCFASVRYRLWLPGPAKLCLTDWFHPQEQYYMAILKQIHGRKTLDQFDSILTRLKVENLYKKQRNKVVNSIPRIHPKIYIE